MKQELDKCVLVIDEAMPRGLAANTAAILGITWGRLRPELVGEDVTDAAGAIHPGIIRTPVPVLSGRPETFQTRARLRPHSRIISRRTYGPCWINRSTSASPPLVYK